MKTKGHQRVLRVGRHSLPGAWYSITTCTDSRRPLLVPDPSDPFAEPAAARLIEQALRWLHCQDRWQCKAYVIMPDHVHFVAVLGDQVSLSKVMRTFGSYTARRLNEMLGRCGKVWQKGFYDHCLRSDESYTKHLRYIVENPVRKGFVANVEDWPFSAIEPDW